MEISNKPYCEEDIYTKFADNPLFKALVESLGLELCFEKDFKGDDKVVVEMLKNHCKDWPE